jgi:hypothetical protein
MDSWENLLCGAMESPNGVNNTVAFQAFGNSGIELGLFESQSSCNSGPEGIGLRLGMVTPCFAN